MANEEGLRPIPTAFEEAFQFPPDPIFSQDFPVPEITSSLATWAEKSEKEEMGDCVFVDLKNPNFIHTFDGSSWNVTGMSQTPRIHDQRMYDALLVKSGAFRIARADLFSALDRFAPHLKDGAPLVVFESTDENEEHAISPRERTLRDHGFELVTMHDGERALVWEGKRYNDRAELEELTAERTVVPDELREEHLLGQQDGAEELRPSLELAPTRPIRLEALRDTRLFGQLPEGKIAVIDAETPNSARLYNPEENERVTSRGKEVRIDLSQRAPHFPAVVIQTPPRTEDQAFDKLVKRGASMLRRAATKEDGIITEQHSGTLIIIEEDPNPDDRKVGVGWRKDQLRRAGLVVDQQKGERLVFRAGGFIISMARTEKERSAHNLFENPKLGGYVRLLIERIHNYFGAQGMEVDTRELEKEIAATKNIPFTLSNAEIARGVTITTPEGCIITNARNGSTFSTHRCENPESHASPPPLPYEQTTLLTRKRDDISCQNCHSEVVDTTTLKGFMYDKSDAQKRGDAIVESSIRCTEPDCQEEVMHSLRTLPQDDYLSLIETVVVFKQSQPEMVIDNDSRPSRDENTQRPTRQENKGIHKNPKDLHEPGDVIPRPDLPPCGDCGHEMKERYVERYWKKRDADILVKQIICDSKEHRSGIQIADDQMVRILREY